MNLEINKGVPKECQEMHAIEGFSDTEKVEQSLGTIKEIRKKNQAEFDLNIDILRDVIKRKENFNLQEVQEVQEVQEKIRKDLEQTENLSPDNCIARFSTFLAIVKGTSGNSKQEIVEASKG